MDTKELAARIADELGTAGASDDGFRLREPPRVADHELDRRIGVGGYGEVWLARSVTGQWRAVKVVARARFESDRPYEREYRGVVQFEPISRSHSGLIQVLHVGRDDGVGAFYYVMELADGVATPGGSDGPRGAGADGAGAGSGSTPDLDPRRYRPRTLRSDLEARGRLPVAEVAAIGVQLCGALGHIHRCGLVHRDVKPSNVIFVQGQPKLADLGLVAATGEARSFVGTEGFIPPEGPGSVKADLFALGRLLYEAATGQDRCAFPEVPSDLDVWPDRDAFLELNEVLARLCAPEPERRCGNAAEAAGDLNLVLAGRSVRRAYGVERRLRWATRVSVVALAVLALAGGAVWLQSVRQWRAEVRAAEERTLRERAQVAERTARQQLYTALLEQARATVRSGELGQRVRALDAIRRAALIRSAAELRREAVAALALPDLRLERELPLGARYTARQLDPAFERVALCVGRGPVEIRRVADDQVLATLPSGTNLTCYNVTWSPDGRHLTVKRDHDDPADGAELEVWRLGEAPRRVLWIAEARRDVRAWHPHRPLLLTADAQGRIVTWDLEAGVEVGRRTLYDGVPEYLTFTPDGRWLAAVLHRRNTSVVSVHDGATGALSAAHDFSATVTTVAWRPDGNALAVTDRAGNVHLFEPATGTVRTLGRHRAEAVTAVFDRSGDYLLTGGWERSLNCWDLRTGQRAFLVELDSYHVQVRADGRQWALLSPTGMQIHGFERPLPLELAEDLGPRLRFGAFSPDGRWLAAAADARLGVWDLRQGGPGAVTEAGAQATPYWTRDGSELFGSRRDEACLRWRVRPGTDGEPVPTLERLPLPHPPGFNWLSVASDALAWTGSRGSQIVRLDQLTVDESAWRRTAQGMNGLSADGRWLGVYRGYTPDLYVYRRPDLAAVARLTCRASIAGFQFSPSGDEVAVASRGQVEFWSTRTWEPTRVLTNFAGIPHVGVLVQPDGGGWWLAPEQRFAGLYAADTLELRLPLPGAMSPLAVSADGRLLAVSVEARRLQVWDIARVRSALRELGLDWDETR